MWEMYSVRAKRATYLATEAAREFGNREVGPAQLLLGVLEQPDSVAARSLVAMGIDISHLSSALRSQLSSESCQQEMELSKKGKQIIDDSYREMRAMKQTYIGTEHLLLALLRECSRTAVKPLVELGIGIPQAREIIARVQREMRPPRVRNLERRQRCQPEMKQALPRKSNHSITNT